MTKKTVIRTRLVIALLFITSFIATNSMSQDAPSAIVPPSPTAASLGKFGDIPVSTYTGIPNISIPIWNISDGKINVPIELKYHASGLKVEEVPSWVGAGWTLNAGGVITRSVRGYPDESEIGYLMGGFGQVVDSYMKNELNNPNDFKVNVANGIFDTQPDIFYYNFLDYSGSFILDKNGVPLLFPSNDLKVSGDMEIGFTIITPKGMRLKFDIKERTEVYPKNTQNDNIFLADDYIFTSSWYLSEIKSTSGDRVSFSYSDETIEHTSIAMELLQRPLVAQDGRCPSNDIDSWNLTFIHKKKLSSIFSKTSSVKFNAHTFREDLSGAKRLDQIQIKSSNILIKSYSLNYSYFGDAGCKRLRLDAFTELGFNGETSNPYTFEYNSTDPPCFNSKSQDFWGYLNKNPRPTLIPSVNNEYSDMAILRAIPQNMNYQADRNSDESGTKAGILKKINYPTGGNTLFEYELNDYGFINNTKVEGVLLGDYQEFAQAEVIWNPDNLEDELSEMNFSIDAEQEVKVYWSIWPTNEPSTTTVLIEDSPATRVSIYNESGLLVFNRNLPTYSVLEYLPLEPGNYTALAQIDTQNSRSFISIFAKEVIGELKSKPAGGLRIKKITDYNGISHDNDMVKEYTYKMENENDRSSGVRGNSPNFTHLKSKEHIFVDSHGFSEFITCNSVFITSYTTQPLTYTQGNSVGYREVSILNGEYGKTIKKYTSNFDYPDWTFSSSPTTQPISNDFNRGLLKEEKVYKNVNNIFKIIKSDTNIYELSHSGRIIYGLNIGYLDEKAISNLSTFSLHLYNYRERWNKLVSRETKNYQNDGNFLSKRNIIYYNTPDHFQIVKKQTTNSEGQTIEINYNYPQDYSSPSNTISTMISKNMIVPIEQIQKVDGQVISASATEYHYDITNDIVVPKNIYKFETITPSSGFSESTNGTTFTVYDKKVTYHKYDNKGNILEYSKEGNVHICYIWGYNQSYPVAQVVNTTYAEIEALSGFGLNFQLGAGKLSAIQEQNLRNLSDVRVTTYTYKTGIGLETVTDPNGVINHYEYDNFGRLEFIKDHENNVIEKFEYEYSKKGLPEWMPTGGSRCVLVDGINTGEIEREEKDSNPLSSSYNNLRWVVDRVDYQACSPSVWEDTGNIRCLIDNNGLNTGVREKEQRDINQSSPFFNSIQWVYFGYSSTLCPVPGGNISISGNNITGSAFSIDINSAEGVMILSNPLSEIIQVNGLTQLSIIPETYSGSYYLVVRINNTPFFSAQISEEKHFPPQELYDGAEIDIVIQTSINQTYPQWQDTGLFRCVQNAGENNGEREKQQKDINQYSVQYNETKWVNIGQDLNTCPLPQSGLTFQVLNNTTGVFEIDINNGSISIIVSGGQSKTDNMNFSANVNIDIADLTFDDGYDYIVRVGSNIKASGSANGNINLSNLHFVDEELVTIILNAP